MERLGLVFLGKWAGNGVNDSVLALAVFDDGSGPALYVGGEFTRRRCICEHIARWNGSGWSALGSGLPHYVEALTAFDDGGGPALCAGGWFTSSPQATATWPSGVARARAR